MRVLITGAGLIGSHTAAELTVQGDEVTLFDVVARPEYIRHVTGKDLPFIRGDIRDLASLADAFLTVRPDCVIHLAASVGEANIKNLYAGFQVNLVATLNVAEAVRLAGVRRLVHASTQALYLGEDPKELLYEDSPLDGRGHGRAHRRSRNSDDRRMWSLDPARKATRVQPHHDRLAEAPLLRPSHHERAVRQIARLQGNRVSLAG